MKKSTKILLGVLAGSAAGAAAVGTGNHFYKKHRTHILLQKHDKDGTIQKLIADYPLQSKWTNNSVELTYAEGGSSLVAVLSENYNNELDMHINYRVAPVFTGDNEIDNQAVERGQANMRGVYSGVLLKTMVESFFKDLKKQLEEDEKANTTKIEAIDKEKAENVQQSKPLSDPQES